MFIVVRGISTMFMFIGKKPNDRNPSAISKGFRRPIKVYLLNLSEL